MDTLHVLMLIALSSTMIAAMPEPGLSKYEGLEREKRSEQDTLPTLECCQHSKTGRENLTTEEWQMYEQCEKDVVEAGEISNGQAKYDCVTQCFGEKTGMVDREGNVVAEVFLQTVSRLYWEEAMKNVLNTVGKACVEDANKRAKGLRHQDPETYSCSPALTLANLCTLFELELNCPAGHKQESERCDQYRNSLRNMKYKIMA